MKKTPCPICTRTKGRRDCLLHNGALICSRCCAELRCSETCSKCPHFSEAEKHTVEKIKKSGSPHFLIEINPEVEQEIDNALIVLENGNHAKAERLLTDILLEHPINHLAHYGMGCVHAMKEEVDQAIDHFKTSVEIYPYFTEAWHNLGTAYKKSLKLNHALICAQKVLQYCNPTDREYASNKEFLHWMTESAAEDGLTLDQYIKNGFIFDDAFEAMEQADLQSAKEGFLKVLSYTKSHVQANGNLGLCYALSGEKALALEYLDKALELDPDYEIARNNRIPVAKMKEGEKLQTPMGSINYYPDKLEQQNPND
jgi:tetratricopeptide (TPR) repeat protein